MKELKVGDKIKFIRVGNNWTMNTKSINEVFKLTSISKTAANLTFAEVSTGRIWYMSEDFLNDSLINGYFILLEEAANSLVGIPAKWSCNHIRLASDVECPVCRAFGRRTTN